MLLTLSSIQSKEPGTKEFPVEVHRIAREANTKLFWPHWHEDLEILYFECSAICFLDDVRLEVNSGDIVFVNKETFHFGNIKECGCFYAIRVPLYFLSFETNDFFQKNIIAPLNMDDIKFSNILTKENNGYADIKENIVEIISSMHKKEFGYQIGIKIELYKLLFNCYVNSIFVKSLPKQRNANFQMILESVEYMEKHTSENITIDILAGRANLSKYHYLHLFKKIIGDTPINYLIELRLSLAEKILLNGESVTNTCYKCGFNDISYFGEL